MLQVKDVITDIVKHTGLPFIEHVKLTGSNSETVIDSMDGDRTVIVKGKLNTPLTDLEGEIGLGNLGFLKGVLNLPNYKADGSTVEIVYRDKNNQKVADHLLFKDSVGNTDKYRFMSKEIIDQVLKTVKFKGVVWDIVVTPTKQNVSELQSISSIYGGIEPNFTLKTENKNLIVTVGNSNGSFSGKRIFATQVGGDLKEQFAWPLKQVLAILNLGMSGKCTLSVSKVGALQITVDSGIGQYDYILPALTPNN
jgi:hypothetical protein